MPKKKIISEKVKSSESLRGSKGNIMAEIRSLDQPVAYAYVANCLHIIAYGKILHKGRFPYFYRYGVQGVEECIITIKNCIKEGRLDLIEKAARLLQGDKKLLAIIWLRDTAERCVELPLDDDGCGFDPILPSKAGVLQVFRLTYPELEEHLPESPRQRAEWWKEIGYNNLPQGRAEQNTIRVKSMLQYLKGKLPGQPNS